MSENIENNSNIPEKFRRIVGILSRKLSEVAGKEILPMDHSVNFDVSEIDEDEVNKVVNDLNVEGEEGGWTLTIMANEDRTIIQVERRLD